MAKINILDSTVYNQISAGEVVERPASVVKELIENSIDAGANQITIEISNGGIDKIIIRDNGVGIEHDDVKNAFKPHATSKIKDARDIMNISTMGFRGEALASIASVSQVELSTKSINEELGSFIEIQGGEIIDFKEIPFQDGTTIEISNIFFNVPARKKFLKKPKSEENAITDVVSRLILTHYDISFKYVIDGKEIFSTSGTELEEALYEVYGKTILDNIIKLNFSNFGVEISGYLGKPIFPKPNRNYQTLSINGRYVKNSNVSIAVQRGYDNYLMKGKFPFFVLNINIPNDSVDINVHPQKMEVRLENDGQIFSAVYKGVQDALLKNRELATFTDFAKQFQSAPELKEQLNKTEDAINNQNLKIDLETGEILANQNTLDNKINEKPKNEEYKLDEKVQNNSKFDNSLLKNFQNIELSNYEKTGESYENTINSNFTFASSSVNNSLHKVENNTNNIKNEIDIQNKNNSNESNFSEPIETEQNSFLNKSYKLIGVIFDTYILIEQDNNFIVIDQHACHERILFEKLKEKIDNKKFSSHTLLIPYIFDVTFQESEILSQLIPNLKEIGFDIEEFGHLSYKISAVPFDDYVSFDCRSFIQNLLRTNFKTNNVRDNLKDFLATRACKSAVKGGDKLDNSEVEYLVNEIIDCNTPMFCPHGRPIAIKFEKKDIEKWFKRIV